MLKSSYTAKGFTNGKSEHLGISRNVQQWAKWHWSGFAGYCIAERFLSFTSTAGTSTLLNESTDIIMLVADTACFVKVGEGSPVATTLSDVRIPANYPLYFLVNKPGQTKVSDVL